MAPPAPPRALTPRLLWFWAGLAIFAAIGLAGYFIVGGTAGLLAALVMLAITAAPAVWAMRAGRIALGSGILTGYAFATALSAGQCTLWSASADYGFLSGFAYYAIALVCILILCGIMAMVEFL